VVLLPAVIALVFIPTLASPFLVPKASLLLIAVGAIVACAELCGASAGLRKLPKGLVTTLLAWSAWQGVAFVFSPLKRMGVEALVFSIAGPLLFLAAVVLLQGSLQRLIVAVSASASLIATVALAQFAFHFDPFVLFHGSSSQSGRMRVFGTLGNPDFCGEFLAATLPAICCLRSRAWRWSALLLTLAAILCTGSRAAMTAAAVALGVYMVLSETRQQRKTLIAAAVLAVLACGLLASGRWNGRPLSTALEGRVTLWRASLSPITRSGSGPGTFSYVYLPRVGEALQRGVPLDPRFLMAERHAQNDFVEAIVETGPLGAVLMLAVLLAWAKAARGRHGEAVPLAFAIVASIAVSAMFDFPLHRAETLALLAIAMALPFAEAAETPSSTSSRLSLRAPLAALLLAALTWTALPPLMSSRYTRRGLEAEARIELASAAENYRRALGWQESNTDAQFSLTRALALQERYPGALRQSQIAQEYIAEPELWILRARILESMGEEQRAWSEMETAARIFPYSPLPKMEIEAIRSNLQH